MRLPILRTGLALSLVAGAAVSAQGPGAPMGPRPDGPMPARAAEQFLARVGELQLTDAQVTRLAAIARRGAARREAQRASFDSMRTRMLNAPPADSAARAARRASMQATMDRVRDQNQADLRDALAVLTPDQQAKAWQFRAGGRMGMRRMREGMRRGARPRDGAGPARGRDDGPRMRAPRGQRAPGGPPGRPIEG